MSRNTRINHKFRITGLYVLLPHHRIRFGGISVIAGAGGANDAEEDFIISWDDDKRPDTKENSEGQKTRREKITNNKNQIIWLNYLTKEKGIFKLLPMKEKYLLTSTNFAELKH